MGKVIAHFDMPGMTANQYDKVWEDLRNAGAGNPKGLLHHVGAEKPDGWLVVDVWESAEDMDEFGKTLMPILSNNGIPQVQPTILPLHYEYIGK